MLWQCTFQFLPEQVLIHSMWSRLKRHQAQNWFVSITFTWALISIISKARHKSVWRWVWNNVSLSVHVLLHDFVATCTPMARSKHSKLQTIYPVKLSISGFLIQFLSIYFALSLMNIKIAQMDVCPLQLMKHQNGCLPSTINETSKWLKWLFALCN